MAERDVRERDILVAANEYAYVQDLTKGDIVLYVGPTKISLSNTERLVELRNDRFTPVRAEEGAGVAAFVSATSAQYVVLENPAKDPAAKPVKGSNSAIELHQGRRVVVPGPATFPLWPGQRARVLDGHTLYEDQYLRVRVYDRVEGANAPIGSERIIKGSETSFWIPTTGLEVVPEAGGYVRNAVTLLDGQFCILRGPQGRRRHVRGPAVVFPEAWEEFVTRNGSKAFAAWPMKKERGLHVRAVKSFEVKEVDQVAAGSYRAGQELFLQEQEGFFFPTENLEVLGEVQPIPLADKEGLYIRHLASGRMHTVSGPKMFLPDPTQVEVVKRPLDPNTAQLYGMLAHDSARAIAVSIPPSYAVLVVGRAKREVVRGPAVRILDFDEELEVLTLSTGKPKTDAALLTTCFLQTGGNKVSDVIRVRTADHVELEVALSYRVSFTSRDGTDDTRWFNVKNYVALLCDHLGSIIRATVRGAPIDAFHARSAEIIRSAVLGEKKENERRAGRVFEENGMLVYDVEVLEVRILDGDVKKLLADAQRTAIVSEVGRRQEQLRLTDEELREQVNRAVNAAKLQTLQSEVKLEEAQRALAVVQAESEGEFDRVTKLANARNDAEALALSSQAETAAAERRAEVDRKALESRTTAFRAQMESLAPELIATLKMLGNQQLAGALTENLAPLAILGGESVADVASRLLEALPIGPSGDGAAKVLKHKRTE